MEKEEDEKVTRVLIWPSMSMLTRGLSALVVSCARITASLMSY